MKIKLVDKKTAVKRITTTVIIIVVLIIALNYYINPIIEKQLEATATTIASQQKYSQEKALTALADTITSITDKLVYAYIIVAIARTIIGLLDHRKIILITSRTLTIAYIAYTYIALNQGKITINLGENTITINISQLLTTTIISITLIITGITTIQLAHTIKQNQEIRQKQALKQEIKASKTN